jgi:glycosyltransferase involved in cell wall biosynthesis
MKIAYATQHDPKDIDRFSGTTSYMAEALRTCSSTFQPLGPLDTRLLKLLKLKELYYESLIHKRYLRNREPALLRYYAWQLQQKLKRTTPVPDVIFSPETVPIAHLDCPQPIVFWVDATFAGMVDFYAKFMNLCPETIRQGHQMEQMVLDKCSLAIYASDWAAKSAIAHYDVPPEKVKVVPFGANIECSRSFDDVQQLVQSRDQQVCQLLFIGVDWVRKGGDIALQVASGLNAQGLKTELTVIGCHPESDEPLPAFVKPLGFISKGSATGMATIQKALTTSHFLILPSVAECFGIVFCEASSYGVPSIATRVGGIPTAIKDHQNGKLFPLGASIQDYCSFIVDTFSDSSRYTELALSSFNEYQTRLNWSVAGKAVQHLIQDHIL